MNGMAGVDQVSQGVQEVKNKVDKILIESESVGEARMQIRSLAYSIDPDVTDIDEHPEGRALVDVLKSIPHRRFTKECLADLKSPRCIEALGAILRYARGDGEGRVALECLGERVIAPDEVAFRALAQVTATKGPLRHNAAKLIEENLPRYALSDINENLDDLLRSPERVLESLAQFLDLYDPSFEPIAKFVDYLKSSGTADRSERLNSYLARLEDKLSEMLASKEGLEVAAAISHQKLKLPGAEEAESQGRFAAERYMNANQWNLDAQDVGTQRQNVAVALQVVCCSSMSESARLTGLEEFKYLYEGVRGSNPEIGSFFIQSIHNSNDDALNEESLRGKDSVLAKQVRELATSILTSFMSEGVANPTSLTAHNPFPEIALFSLGIFETSGKLGTQQHGLGTEAGEANLTHGNKIIKKAATACLAKLGANSHWHDTTAAHFLDRALSDTPQAERAKLVDDFKQAYGKDPRTVRQRVLGPCVRFLQSWY